ncbi:hypothetical protein BDR04DRAFT_1158900 [Suillus decipiens]|nr:hypothetical protein BDR04DRAFT_1158900 [Suillus decipiens]
MSSSNTQPKTMSSTEAPTQPTSESFTDNTSQVPPHKHAGTTGTSHAKGAGLGQKIEGLEEEIRGMITKNPELLEQGRERRTGTLKKKEQEQANEDPFTKPGEHSQT